METVERLTLSQERKPQTHSGKMRDLQRISDFSQQDYQVQSAIGLCNYKSNIRRLITEVTNPLNWAEL